MKNSEDQPPLAAQRTVIAELYVRKGALVNFPRVGGLLEKTEQALTAMNNGNVEPAMNLLKEEVRHLLSIGASPGLNQSIWGRNRGEDITFEAQYHAREIIDILFVLNRKAAEKLDRELVDILKRA